MSLGTRTAIDNLIQSSLPDEFGYKKLEWIPFWRINDIKPSQIDNVHYAVCNSGRPVMMMLLLLGSDETCTPTFMNEFARIYSLPTHKYNSDASQFRRYSKWLYFRNKLIVGFTENDGHYYMVAYRSFYSCYSLYGFCSTCGILRCSPVWCICGYKRLSKGWTSNNEQLDEFIKKSQIKTNSANEAYLEWIPFDWIADRGYYDKRLNGLPTSNYERVKLTPLAIINETHDVYYTELCDEHPDILVKDVWITIGFTYNTSEQKYYLIEMGSKNGSCLACTQPLPPEVNAFCYGCKAPRPVDWTTGNKSLDSLITESWKNTKKEQDAFIQWIEYSLLTNIQKVTSLRHGCNRTADWLDLTTNESTRVMLKKIIDNRSFDFRQLTKKYPEIITPDNIWIIGITQEPSTRKYYLVFYYDIHSLLDRFIRKNKRVKYIQHTAFDEIKEIGSGGYATVYTARYSERNMSQIVVLKRFKNFDGTPELFISEFRNHVKCINRSYSSFLDIYGVTQDPETKDYIIVMQYANNGNLLSYLDQNINKLTWRMKLEHLMNIAYYMCVIHDAGIVHCDLHGGNIVLHSDDESETGKDFRTSRPLICDLGLSRSVNSRESSPTIRGVFPFIAPEVFHTRKFTTKSDIYSFGIIMYLIATGESPFKNRQFDRGLICDITGGLRPSMPDSAPEEYKKLAERCCDADPDKRPDAWPLYDYIYELIGKVVKDNSDVNTWNTIYHNNVRPLSRLEKDFSALLPTGDLLKTRNIQDAVSIYNIRSNSYYM